EGVINKVLCIVVEGDIRLLDDKNRGIMKVRPRECDAELFIRLEVMAERTNDRIVAVRQVLNEVMGMSHLCGVDDARQGVDLVSQTNIHQDGVREHQIGLEDRGDLGSDRVKSCLSEIASIDRDPPGLGVGKPGYQAAQRELRIFIETENRNAGSGGDFDRDIIEQVAARAAFQGDIFQSNLLLQGIEEKGSDVL